MTGQILDENYTKLLLSQTDMDLMDAIALDKVQKRRPLNDESLKRLRALKLIEGRRPNVFVSAKVAAATGDKAAYIKNRAFDKPHYKDMVGEYLNKFGEATRAELDNLLLGKLSDALDANQKKTLITNFLQQMKKDGQIELHGVTRWAKWRLSSKASEARD